METHLFTSAAANYLPKVRVLLQSLRELHPEWTLHLALADQLSEGVELRGEPIDSVLHISELGIPNWKGWAFCHSIVELSTAIKPFALAHLLRQPGTRQVLYLDPDIVAFSRLDEIIRALEESNIILTPHQTVPERTLASIIDNEIGSSLQHGVYNLGFIAVAATQVGHDFAEWWSRRVYHFCRAEIAHGLFTDQRWIDLAPAFFEGVAIMRSPRFNVAPWNLTTRTVSKDDAGGYLVNGEPLGFYHFTGFDSGAHRSMARKNGGKNKTVTELIEWYTAQTENVADGGSATKARWAFACFDDGTPISADQRIVYRERVDLQRAFPDPFETTGYLAWWNMQGKLEYPGLFLEDQRPAALLKIKSRLTPGYLGGSERTDWLKFTQLMRAALEPKVGIQLGRKGWEVLRTEGFSGIKRRFQN
jgi:hypothetical protein